MIRLKRCLFQSKQDYRLILPIILSTTMHRKKLEQIKTYSKIIKYRKNNGQIEEIALNQTPNNLENNIEEEYEHQIPKEEDFQDVIEDQFEQEQGWISDSGEEEEGNESGTMMSEPKKNEMIEEQQKPKVFLGSNKNLAKGQVLQFDNKAYDMLHRLNVEWPSMSIDFVAKNSPFDATLTNYLQMNQYPYQVFTVQGSCNNTSKNSIYFTKWSKLHQTKFDDDPEGNDDDEDPQIVVQQVETTFDVNRIRTLNNSPIVAFWNDDGNRGEVRIVDLSSNLEKLNNNVSSKRKEKAKQIIIPFDVSGYGLAWNPHKVGELVVGDNNGRVTVLANNANYTEWSKLATYAYHKGSVQDIVFSPQQSFVFASCSSDGTLQVVDMRANNYNKAQLKIKAHKKDVNVCDWNKMAAHLIVTGSDDCTVKVWDLRMASEGAEEEVLSFSWHTEPITSIKFQPNEQSVIAVASEDNRLSIWDMSVENEQADPQVPNELLFLHQGQEQIKQICYHPVYFEMIISTSLDAINIFKPALEMPEMGEDEKADKQDLKRPPIKQQELDKYIERMNIQ